LRTTTGICLAEVSRMSSRTRRSAFVGISMLLGTLLLRGPLAGLAQSAVALPNPILFVTQVPVPGDFTSIGSVFGNQQGSAQSVARGGDLWIRYGDGSLKNLTQSAGYGASGLQGAASIAVREPSVHWSGTKALFSMVIGRRDQAVRGRPVLLPDLRDHGTRADRNAGHHEGAESAGQLQQRQPDLWHRRADHLHLRSAAQRRSRTVPATRLSTKKRRPSPASGA
jgi:hypothetical protein